jgi:cysteine desulfurase
MFDFFSSSRVRRVYADYAAATPLDEDVKKAMLPFLSGTLFGNPASIHSFGREAKRALEQARKTIAETLQVQSDEIIFTGGGTEGNNLGITGIVSSSPVKHPHIITSRIEHAAILEPIRFLERKGFLVTYLPVNEKGRVDLKNLEASITEETILISLAYANSETGTIERIREIGNLIKKYKEKQPLYFHTDASQAGNFLSLFPNDLHVDLMTLDALKVYGPKGVGLLFVKRGTPLTPLLRGGMQEKGLRAGTQNVPGIVGFAAALLKAERMRKTEGERIKKLRDLLKEELLKHIDGATVNGLGEILPNVLNINFPEVDAEFLSVKLDQAGIAVSSASACRSISGSGSSYVIEALPGREGYGKSSLRFSFGRETSLGDIKYIAKVLPELLKP